MVRLTRSNFLENQFTKSVGPSLGVNCTWTKRNEHAPKSECAYFLQYNMSKYFKVYINHFVWIKLVECDVGDNNYCFRHYTCEILGGGVWNISRIKFTLLVRRLRKGLRVYLHPKKKHCTLFICTKLDETISLFKCILCKSNSQ